MITINNIHKSFREDFWKPKNKVLKGVTFNIEKGSCTGFLGINGSGKTTLLKIILGLSKPDEGTISFDEDLGVRRKEIHRHIGFVPERPYLYPELTGIEFINFMGSLSKVSSLDIKKSISTWGKRLKIDYALDKKLGTYSKGMLQRLAIYSALIHNPQIILMDEPLSGLDPIGRKEIKNIIKELKENGKTIFICTHIVNDLEEICDHITLLKNGVIAFNGHIDELTQKNNSGRVVIKHNDKSLETNNEQLQESIKKLVANGSTIHSIEREHKSLEDIIFENKDL